MPERPIPHAPRRVLGPGFHARVFAVVRTVPPGWVTTYGDVAAALGRRQVARRVGEALGACPDDVPWHRVVNARGMVSVRADGRPSAKQIRLLRREGIAVDADGRIHAFEEHRFLPEAQP
ncbi:MAG TPA: MGMT family protein [Planctomycetota bacterium]|nr:MGMT family protein [Planctomycetota bacterium]